eukprot:Awhi_evm1s6686
MPKELPRRLSTSVQQPFDPYNRLPSTSATTPDPSPAISSATVLENMSAAQTPDIFSGLSPDLPQESKLEIYQAAIGNINSQQCNLNKLVNNIVSDFKNLVIRSKSNEEKLIEQKNILDRHDEKLNRISEQVVEFHTALVNNPPHHPIVDSMDDPDVHVNNALAMLENTRKMNESEATSFHEAQSYSEEATRLSKESNLKYTVFILTNFPPQKIHRARKILQTARVQTKNVHDLRWIKNQFLQCTVLSSYAFGFFLKLKKLRLRTTNDYNLYDNPLDDSSRIDNVSTLVIGIKQSIDRINDKTTKHENDISVCDFLSSLYQQLNSIAEINSEVVRKQNLIDAQLAANQQQRA